MGRSTIRSLEMQGGGRPAELGADHRELLGWLAAHALTQVAGRVLATQQGPGGRAVERLHAAAVGPDRRACGEVARQLIAGGLAAERICDASIPGAARRMGEDWVSGALPFSTVTIGAARLQGLLRELDGDFAGRSERATGLAGAILLVIPAGADHTLGPMLLASQLRRRGFSVRLSLGEPAEAVARAAAATRFDAVFLSSALARFLPQLAGVAAAIRAAMPGAPPIVLGGAVAAEGDEAAWGSGTPGPDLAAIDHVTGDLDEALRLCGLTAAPCG